MTRGATRDLLDLRGRVAIVTGGAAGIGATVAATFADAGARVAVFDGDERAAVATAERICNAGGHARAWRCDVADVLDGKRAVADVADAFGGLDVLVNNAGIFPPTAALSIAEAMWDRVLSTNLKGAFFMSQSAARHMTKNGGAIVNVAAVDAIHPTGSLAHYDASMGGLLALTRSLAKELGPMHIRVNAVALGAVASSGSRGAKAGESTRDLAARVPLGRLGEPEEVANAALFFATRASAYITGSALAVDGGFLLS